MSRLSYFSAIYTTTIYINDYDVCGAVKHVNDDQLFAIDDNTDGAANIRQFECIHNRCDARRHHDLSSATSNHRC